MSKAKEGTFQDEHGRVQRRSASSKDSVCSFGSELADKVSVKFHAKILDKPIT